jgi:hypothetical protein
MRFRENLSKAAVEGKAKEEELDSCRAADERGSASGMRVQGETEAGSSCRPANAGCLSMNKGREPRDSRFLSKLRFCSSALFCYWPRLSRRAWKPTLLVSPALSLRVSASSQVWE